MTDAEVREVVADLMDDTPTVMPDGRMRGEHAWRQTGVNRDGATGHRCEQHRMIVRSCRHCIVLSDAHWYETTEEMFERNAA